MADIHSTAIVGVNASIAEGVEIGLPVERCQQTAKRVLRDGVVEILAEIREPGLLLRGANE